MNSIQMFHDKKTKNEKISMVTCYDFTTAQVLNETNVDCLLVGDSLAMVMHGYDSTVHATVPMMALHTKAVAKGAPSKFLVADLPFLSFRTGIRDGLKASGRLMQAGAHAVKLEGARGHLNLVKHLVESGIPVMGHLGLTPQSINQFGGFKVQAREAEAQKLLMEDALALEAAGCFSIVLECVPSSLGKKVSEALGVPTIGIGAGVDCDGQVLVIQDLMGMNQKFKPKFLRHFSNGKSSMATAVNQYVDEVQKKTYPNKEESYS